MYVKVEINKETLHPLIGMDFLVIKSDNLFFKRPKEMTLLYVFDKYCIFSDYKPLYYSKILELKLKKI